MKTYKNEEIIKWGYSVVSQSKLNDQEKERAKQVVQKVVQNGGWRGDISDALIGAGFTNEQFRFQLFV